MNSRYKRGWYGESQRHYLAAKGIKTNRYHANKYYAYSPTFVAGDMAPIAADGIGTAGAAVVPWIPVIVPVALAYGGAKWAVDRKKKRAKKGKGFFAGKSDFIEIDGQVYFKGEGDVLINVKNPVVTAEFNDEADFEAAQLSRMYGMEPSRSMESVFARPIPQASGYFAEKLKGGMADGKDDCRYDQRQLEAGIKVEMEHTKDKKLAKEIAKDHLEEIPDYYTRLAHMEACAKRHYEGAPGMGWASGGREMVYAARKGNGLFGPPKNEKLAKKIRITSPEDFRKSMSTLKGKDGKVTTEEKRALTLARTRAAMQLRRENLKPETRKKFKEISQMELPEVR